MITNYNSIKNKNYLRVSLVFLSLFFATTSVTAQNVSIHLTKGDQTALLQEQAPIAFNNGELPNATITVDETNTFQTMDGFGFCLTQGSAEAISHLPTNEQDTLLNEIFNPNSGESFNTIVRISIGASDLSNSVYYYNNTPGDVQMNNFSLDGPDAEYLIPILKKIVQINPEIKVLATPWSAPVWMKTNRNTQANPSIGGRLDTAFYDAYARYFVKYLEAMQNEGISIWGITPQNEPENPFNEPSMAMNANEQLDFINNHLGPQIEASGFTPKIIAFDHNCDNVDYPINVLNNSDYVDGAAFHLYGGDISAMSVVKNQTNKNVYFTEQFTGIDGNFDGDFGWHIENVVIGSMRNWSKAVIEWNLASFPESRPRTPGGCTECLPAITINENTGALSRNVMYYIITQVSKFIKAGAVRIESNADGVLNVAVRNPNGEKVLLMYNINRVDRAISVNWSGKSLTYNLPARSAATLTWAGNFIPQAPAQITNVNANEDDAEVNLTWNAASGTNTYEVLRSANQNGPFTAVATGLTGTNYTDTNVTNGTAYYYKIRAVNTVGSSESPTVSATPNLIIINAFNRIEAEDFNENNGLQTEETQDVDGNLNIGFTDTDDFLLYKNVDFGNGATSILARIASNADFVGTMEIRLDSNTGNLIGTVEYGNTGGWQNWITRTVEINETSGLQDVYLVFKGGSGVGNLNWFQFDNAGVLSTSDITLNTISLYPNPTLNFITITSPMSEVNGVTITDIQGRVVKTLDVESLNTYQLDVSKLGSAIYFITIDSTAGSITKRVIKN